MQIISLTVRTEN